jgi:hypothetical protein
MSVKITAMGLAMGMAVLLPSGAMLSASSALAQSVVPNVAPSAHRAAPSDISAQARKRRPRVRIYREDERGVYPSYNPGPNAVRECTAHYVQEFRPSGTVIVPRMNCYWRRG